MGQSKGSRIGDSKASFSCLAETRYVDMLSVDLNTLKIGLVLLLESNCEIQSGIESCVAVLVFVLPGVKSCKCSKGPVEIVPHTARTTGKNCNSGLVSSLSELEQIEDMTITIANSEYTRLLEACKTVSLAGRAQVRSVVVVTSLQVVMWFIRCQKLDCWESAHRSQEDEDDATRRIAMQS